MGNTVEPYVTAIIEAERSFGEMERLAERGGYQVPVEFAREKDFALQIVSASTYLQRQDFMPSLRAAVQNVALCGITLNPIMKLAYLVPRNNRVCLDISYMGLIKIATDSGSVNSVQSHLVYSNDEFDVELGTNKHISHKPTTFKDRGTLVGVYVIAVLANGEELFETMSLEECHAIRDRSQAWKAYVKDSRKLCPWVTDEGEMVRKTCVKRASKYWPKTERLSEAVNVLNQNDGYEELNNQFKKEKAAPVFYSDDDFKANFAKWKKGIEEGKITKANLIIKAESKAPLSDAQKKKVNEIKEPTEAEVVDG